MRGPIPSEKLTKKAPANRPPATAKRHDSGPGSHGQTLRHMDGRTHRAMKFAGAPARWSAKSLKGPRSERPKAR